ncbi:MAG: ribosome-associated translation inhibitor RaiA [Actinobacteria bacterium]|nr:ribosome-associated translation inhibitor RaiA [Actinomycetota bacterium]
MELIVKGRHVEVTGALRSYAEDKIGRVAKYFDRIQKIEIEFTDEKNPSIINSKTVEVTVFPKGPILRAKESSSDMYASIDMVVDKLERQIKRFKNKKNYKSTKHAPGLGELALASFAGTAREELEGPRIVKVKQVAVKPMDPEEATMQMELLGHDFFVFTNANTEEVNVVYKRKDNNYGLIEPIYGKA